MTQNRRVIYKPFCFKIFKSVEFAFTLGILDNARTLMFLEGNSLSPSRMSRPFSGHIRTHKHTHTRMLRAAFTTLMPLTLAHVHTVDVFV